MAIIHYSYSRQFRYLVGIAALVAVGICWAIEAESLQSLQEPTSPNYFNKPYFMSYVTFIGYLLFFIPWLVLREKQLFQQGEITGMIFRPRILLGKEERRMFTLTAVLAFIWFLTAYAWCVSLSMTSVTANTIITNSGFIWAFLFSVILLHERVSSVKLLSCILCFTSLALVTVFGNRSEEPGVEQSIIGYVLVFVVAVVNALYDVLFKKYAVEPDQHEQIVKHTISVSVLRSAAHASSLQLAMQYSPKQQANDETTPLLSPVKTYTPSVLFSPQPPNAFPQTPSELPFASTPLSPSTPSPDPPIVNLSATVPSSAPDGSPQTPDGIGQSPLLPDSTPPLYDARGSSPSPNYSYGSPTTPSYGLAGYSPPYGIPGNGSYVPGGSAYNGSPHSPLYGIPGSPYGFPGIPWIGVPGSPSIPLVLPEPLTEKDLEKPIAADQVVSTQNTYYFLWITGVVVLLIFWPGLLICHYVGYETFVFPRGRTLELVILNVLLDAARNFAYLLAVSWTSPLVANVGMLLVIPVSIFFDVLIHSYLLPFPAWIGLGLLCFGFVAMFVSDFLIDMRMNRSKSNPPGIVDHFLTVFGSYYEVKIL